MQRYMQRAIVALRSSYAAQMGARSANFTALRRDNRFHALRCSRRDLDPNLRGGLVPADLKFLERPLQSRTGTSNRKAALRS